MPRSFVTRILEPLVVSFKNAQNKRRNPNACAELGAALMDPIKKFTSFTPSIVIIPGAQAASGAVARRVAQKVADGSLPKDAIFIFVGGMKPAQGDFCEKLLPLQADRGILMPQENEAEGPYMQRAFENELKKLYKPTTTLDLRSDENDQSQNAQQVLKKAAELAKIKEGDRVAIITLPYYSLRTIGTWRHEINKTTPLLPIMVFPNSIGITKDNWKKHPIAKYVITTEGQKYLLPTPETAEFVKRGFCNPVNLQDEIKCTEDHLLKFGGGTTPAAPTTPQP